MKLFDVHALCHVIHNFAPIEAALLMGKSAGQGNVAVTDNLKKGMDDALAKAEELFTVVQLTDCLKDISTAKRRWGGPLLDISAACEIVHRLQEDIIQTLGAQLFFRVEHDRRSLVFRWEGGKAHYGIREIVGDKVVAAFPSAWDDLIEVGSCLVAECNTAAVFHLMRVAEFGLRAVASDRKAPFTNKPIDQQEWGTILGYMDGVIKGLRLDDASNWPDAGVRDIQIRFYSEVTAELRGFNEAWRRHLSHAREGGIYDRNYANSVFTHVKLFMQKLSTKVSENTTTPKYWTEHEAKL
jgi:hypothetical protein